MVAVALSAGIYIEMPLRVIGAGLPRSGTNSLCSALELLGYRVQHMKHLFSDMKLLDTWHGHVVESKPTDWKSVFADFDAAVDGPAA